MATGFVVTAHLNFVLNNFNNVTSQIQKGLNGLNGNVTLNTQKAQQQINALKAQISSLNATVGTGKVNTSGVANATRAYSGVAKAAKQASSAAFEFGEQIGASGRRFAAFSVAAATLFAFVNVMKEGVGQALEFQREMVRFAQVGGDTKAVIGDVAKEITRLSTTLGASSSDLSKVATTLRQAGISAKETQIAMEALARTTLAPTFGTINDTAEASIAIMAQFGAQAKDLNGILGSINAVSAEFAVESNDLTEAIRRSGGAFKAAGGSLNELLALFTAVRSTTRESAETIATGFNTIFARLQRADTVERLKDIGVNLRYTAQEAQAFGKTEGDFIGPYQAVLKLNEALKNVPPASAQYAAIVQELGGLRQQSKLIPLLQQGAKAQRAYQVALGGTNSLTIASDKAQDAFLTQITKLKEEFLDLFRVLTGNKTLQAYASTFLSLARGAVQLAKGLEPLIPLLTTLATIKIASFVGQSIGLLGSSDLTKGIQSGLRRRKGFATGGLVPGTGNTDSVPASLTPGEFVIRKKAVQALGGPVGVEKAIKGYASGGIVDIKPPTGSVGMVYLEGADRKTFGYRGRFKVVVPASRFKKEKEAANILKGKSASEQTRQDIIKASRYISNQSNSPFVDEEKLITNTQNRFKHLNLDQEDIFRLAVARHNVSNYATVYSKSGKKAKRQPKKPRQEFIANTIPQNTGIENAGVAVPIDVASITNQTRTRAIGSFNTAIKEAVKNIANSMSAGVFPQVNEVSDQIVNTTVGQNGKGRLFEAAVQTLTKGITSKSQTANFDFAPATPQIEKLFGPNLNEKYVDAKITNSRANLISVAAKAVRQFGNSRYSQIKDRKDIEKRVKEDDIAKRATYKASTGKTKPGRIFEGTDIGSRKRKFVSFLPKEKKANGGKVDALLMPGEYVVDKSTAQSVGGTKLSQLNQADRIGFASGGSVSTHVFDTKIAPQRKFLKRKREYSSLKEHPLYSSINEIQNRNTRAGFLRLIRGKYNKDVLSQVPPGSKFVGSGVEAAAFQIPSGDVVRLGGLGRDAKERPEHPLILQAKKTQKLGKYVAETLPYAEPLITNPDSISSMTISQLDRLEKIQKSFDKRLGKTGYSPYDTHLGNLARYNKRIVAIDPHTFRAKKKYALGGPVWQEPKTLARAKKIARKIRGFGDHKLVKRALNEVKGSTAYHIYSNLDTVAASSMRYSPELVTAGLFASEMAAKYGGAGFKMLRGRIGFAEGGKIRAEDLPSFLRDLNRKLVAEKEAQKKPREKGKLSPALQKMLDDAAKLGEKVKGGVKTPEYFKKRAKIRRKNAPIDPNEQVRKETRKQAAKEALDLARKEAKFRENLAKVGKKAAPPISAQAQQLKRIRRELRKEPELRGEAAELAEKKTLDELLEKSGKDPNKSQYVEFDTEGIKARDYVFRQDEEEIEKRKAVEKAKYEADLAKRTSTYAPQPISTAEAKLTNKEKLAQAKALLGATKKKKEVEVEPVAPIIPPVIKSAPAPAPVKVTQDEAVAESLKLVQGQSNVVKAGGGFKARVKKDKGVVSPVPEREPKALDPYAATAAKMKALRGAAGGVPLAHVLYPDRVGVASIPPDFSAANAALTITSPAKVRGVPPHSQKAVDLVSRLRLQKADTSSYKNKASRFKDIIGSTRGYKFGAENEAFLEQYKRELGLGHVSTQELVREHRTAEKKQRSEGIAPYQSQKAGDLVSRLRTERENRLRMQRANASLGIVRGPRATPPYSQPATNLVNKLRLQRANSQIGILQPTFKNRRDPAAAERVRSRLQEKSLFGTAEVETGPVTPTPYQEPVKDTGAKPPRDPFASRIKLEEMRARADTRFQALSQKTGGHTREEVEFLARHVNRESNEKYKRGVFRTLNQGNVLSGPQERFYNKMIKKEQSHARRLLGVDKNASAEDIKKAYRSAAAGQHPDRGGDPRKFRYVQEAYETLQRPTHIDLTTPRTSRIPPVTPPTQTGQGTPPPVPPRNTGTATPPPPPPPRPGPVPPVGSPPYNARRGRAQNRAYASAQSGPSGSPIPGTTPGASPFFQGKTGKVTVSDLYTQKGVVNTANLQKVQDQLKDVLYREIKARSPYLSAVQASQEAQHRVNQVLSKNAEVIAQNGNIVSSNNAAVRKRTGLFNKLNDRDTFRDSNRTVGGATRVGVANLTKGQQATLREVIEKQLDKTFTRGRNQAQNAKIERGVEAGNLERVPGTPDQFRRTADFRRKVAQRRVQELQRNDVDVFVDEQGNPIGHAGGIPTLGKKGGVGGFLKRNAGKFAAGAVLAGQFAPAAVDLLGVGTAAAPGKGFTRTQAKFAQATSSAVSESLSGAATGGFALSAFGPPGVAVGAAIGGLAAALHGFISSVKEADEQIKQIDFEKTLSKLSYTIEEVVSDRTKLGPGNTGQLESQLRAVREKSFGEADSGKFLQEQIGGQLGSFQELTAKLAENLVTTGKETDEKLFEKFQKEGNNLGGTLVALIAQLKNIPVSDVSVEIIKSIKALKASKVTEKATKDLAGIISRQETDYKKLSQALQLAALSTEKFQNSMDSILATTEGRVIGAHPQNVGGGLAAFGSGDRATFNKAVDSISGALPGNRGEGLGNAAKSLNEAVLALPELLTSSANKPAASKEDIIGSVSKGLSAKGINDAIIQNLTRAFEKVDTDKFVGDINENIHDFVEKAAKEAGGSIIESLSEIGKLLDDQQKQLNTNLISYNETVAKLGSAADDLVSLQVERTRAQAQILSQRAGRPSESEDLLPLAVRQVPLQRRQERLTGLGGRGANDPTAIGNKLKATATAIEEAQKRFADANRNKDPKGAAQANKSLIDLQRSASNLQEALKNLTNVTERNAAIQDQLNRIDTERQARLGLAEKFARGTPQDRFQINQAANLTATAFQQGHVSNANTDQINQIFDFLDSVKDIRVPFLGNQRGGDVKQRLLENTPELAGIARLPQGQQQAERSLQDELLKNMDRAVKAQETLMSFLQKSNNEFHEKLIASLDKFTETLGKTLNENEKVKLENQRGGVQNQLNEILGKDKRNPVEALQKQGFGDLGQAQRFLQIPGLTEASDLNKQLGKLPKLEALPKFEADNATLVRVKGHTTPDDARDSESTGKELAAIRRRRGLGQGEIGDTLKEQALQLHQSFVNQRRAGADVPILTGHFATKVAGVSGLNIEDVRKELTEKVVDRFNNGAITFEEVGQELEKASREYIERLKGQFQGDFQAKLLDISAREHGVPQKDVTQKQLEETQRHITAVPQTAEDVKKVESAGSFAKYNENLKTLNDQIVDLTNAIKALSPNAVQPVAKARGGLIYANKGMFTPRGTDTVPAMLTPGEFVVNASSTRANKKLLEHINNKKQPIYRAGGGSANLADPKNPRRKFILGALYGDDSVYNPTADTPSVPAYIPPRSSVLEQSDKLTNENQDYLEQIRQRSTEDQESFANDALEQANRRNKLTQFKVSPSYIGGIAALRGAGEKTRSDTEKLRASAAESDKQIAELKARHDAVQASLAVPENTAGTPVNTPVVKVPEFGEDQRRARNIETLRKAAGRGNQFGQRNNAIRIATLAHRLSQQQPNASPANINQPISRRIGFGLAYAHNFIDQASTIDPKNITADHLLEASRTKKYLNDEISKRVKSVKNVKNDPIYKKLEEARSKFGSSKIGIYLSQENELREKKGQQQFNYPEFNRKGERTAKGRNQNRRSRAQYEGLLDSESLFARKSISEEEYQKTPQGALNFGNVDQEPETQAERKRKHLADRLRRRNFGFNPIATDRVPAMLAPGEFVVGAGAARQNIPLLERINKGKKVVHKAAGGLIGGSGQAGTGDTGVFGDFSAAANTLSSALNNFTKPLQDFISGFKDLIAPLNAFSQNVQTLTTPFSAFVGAANPLSTALLGFNSVAPELAKSLEAIASIPQTITVTGTQDVRVVVTGLEALNVINDIVAQKVKEALATQAQGNLVNDIKNGKVL